MMPERFQFSKSAGRFVRYIDTDDVETIIPPGSPKAADALAKIERMGRRKRPPRRP